VSALGMMAYVFSMVRGRGGAGGEEVGGESTAIGSMCQESGALVCEVHYLR